MFVEKIWSNLKKDGYNLELLFLSSHSGTHLDAPYHFINNGPKIHQILPKRLICDALLINVKKNANQEITKNDILKFEKKHGKIGITNHNSVKRNAMCLISSH